MEDIGKVVDIVSDGDVVLVVGPEKMRLRVCARSLAVASKPFSAMFRPDWQEGSDLLKHDLPVDIPLPEDDFEALRLICAVIHHQNEIVPRTLAPPDILRVAAAADKYDCVGALTFASGVWLRLRKLEPRDLLFLTAAAYLFRNAEAFRQITKALVLEYDGPYLDLCNEEIQSAMTWRVVCLLEGQRSLARLELAEILISGINDGGCAHKCGWNSKYAYAYLRLLEHKGLWPAHLLNISKAMKLAESIRDPIPKEQSATCVYEYKHEPPEYRENRRWKLTSFTDNIGLCLFCVRAGSSSSSYCRLDHALH